ncbi:cytochrome P450 [Guyanagaster necrorhizus]|uniref:Cytochrome P450 n=1 Tax=Guyanagaster necrorhizus TaxID=856835 RepID=A0A9P7W2J0_9AGAR|nr:cytochrome P450 [Guyanagaster necrorhizus MCA 3950]KAG7451404.1 cytochrome P450 [Guyanagaster necrorhizus MCA 3950]
MILLTALWILISSIIAHLVYKRWSRISITNIRGPQPHSILYGNFPEMLEGQAGDIDFKWQEEFGDVVRIKAPFGEDRLLLSDPKALQYIYHASGYGFTKTSGRLAVSQTIFGPGLVGVDGDIHRRQRRVMMPGFGTPEIKAFVPIFFTHAGKMAAKWRDIISGNGGLSCTVDVPSWTSRATLDIIGQAAFDYDFGALDDTDNILTKIVSNIVFDTFGLPTNKAILSLSLMDFLPFWLSRFITKSLPISRLSHAHKLNRLTGTVSKQLVKEKYDALIDGKSNKDIMSLLVKANASQNPDTRLSEQELLAQMITIIMAGHETTSNSLSWALLELAKHPEIQSKLRDEIRAKERLVLSRGGSLTATDFDNMPYLTAVVKESLRFHPVSYNVFRVSEKDDVLPLLKPIITKDGKVMYEVPIPKGLQIISSIAAYNRNKDIFGEDSSVFNPDRWLCDNVKSSVSIGMYANLFTFSGGGRACIGWRFAVLELSAFVVELLNNFEFSLTDKGDSIRREACFVMTPTLEGQREKGTQMPLNIRIASREDM